MGPLDVHRDLEAAAAIAWSRSLKSRLLLGLFEAESGLPVWSKKFRLGGSGRPNVLSNIARALVL